jgi:hypothetical protein
MREGNELGDPGIDGRIILKWISRRRIAGSCKCGNKHSGSIKLQLLD